MKKRLEVNGVGFRVSSSNNELEMALGFSHPVKYKAPEGVTVTNEKMIILLVALINNKSAKLQRKSAP